mgnify:CR=1 FL=1
MHLIKDMLKCFRSLMKIRRERRRRQSSFFKAINVYDLSVNELKILVMSFENN